tara:strand:- start:247 stop:570 length:324 start_codon:yes stop_codon:yes gene_type:complete
VRLSQYCKRKRKGKGGCMTAKKKKATWITVKKAQPIIKISEMEFVVNEWKGNVYLNCRSTFTDGTKDNWVDVSDLTDFTVCEYNDLVEELNKYYPDFPINKLEGRYV